MMAREYSWYLRSMAEKPLAESVSPEHAQVYRVVVLPPHSSPVAVRLCVETSGIAELAVKVGQSDRNPEVLAVNRIMNVSHPDVDKFFKLLNDSDFWSLPTTEPWGRRLGRPVAPMTVMGDTSWMLEAIKERGYHLVYRGAANLGPLKDSVVFLVVSLAKVDLRSLPTQPTRRPAAVDR
jgi:hypothetical protein